ncbi:hypothetical protein NRA53_18460, partial [Acinetobacter baumannii]|nr:hypothetical protein [Acinetobacter baumannii]
MGEAKQRGTYEERLSNAKRSILRGVITHSGNLTMDEKSEAFCYSNREVEDMLFYALYWDKISMPKSVIGSTLEIDKELI